MESKHANACRRLSLVAALLLLAAFIGRASCAQTPEQSKLWEAERAQALADERLKAERSARERETRKANPMAWVQTLDPMTAGGWQFRAVSSDGSWATFSTDHQIKRSGKVVTAWLRQEYAEPQTAGGNHYLSLVEKAQFDCGKQQTRALLVIYYAGNNVQGNEQTEEADTRNTPWSPIVPGTRDEQNFQWACSAVKP